MRGLKAIYTILMLGCLTMAVALLPSCNSTRHVPQGSYLLDKVSINVNDSTGTFTSETLLPYLRQLPNHKTLWTAKLRLGIYNMSGMDSTKWWNRWVRRIGEAPVIYDPALTEQSVQQLQRTMNNRGFLHAQVEVDSTLNADKKRASIKYTVNPGEQHVISSVEYNIENDTIREMLLEDESNLILQPGMPLDRRLLDIQRELFSNRLRDRGYYSFNKEMVTFSADTTAGSLESDLTVIVNTDVKAVTGDKEQVQPYYIHAVKVIMNYDPVTMTDISTVTSQDTKYAGGVEILYGDKEWLRPGVIEENCLLRPGDKFNAERVNRTYESFSRLGIIKFMNIQYREVATVGGLHMLDVYILLTPNKSQSLSFELEGTNSEGDLGVAAAVTYQHSNIGHGSETFSAKVRGAYEHISGDFEGLVNNHYMEYTADIGLSVPKFQFPFLSKSFKQKIRASTDFNASFNYQERPEYTRVISTIGWSYKWIDRRVGNRHTVTPLDINYVYLPKSYKGFIDEIAPDNPLLRYSYEDHFIMRMGYSFYYTNKQRETPWSNSLQTNVSTVRVNAETAGNLLWVINSIFTHRSDYRQNPYKVLGIRYSQYLKAEVDYALLHRFNQNHSIAFHAGFGIAFPYGNSTILPFEKRFYGGGANGVRGWDVRTLGPGCYHGTNTVSDFINQCGDIRLILSAEYRMKLFWLFEGALFVDAGNIWTIHNYENQPGGMFHFNSFYKQLAAAYGVGIRMDFKYFLIRFDMGMKAHNPALGAEPWPLIHPNWKRDRSFHFSIGYPF